MKLGITQHPVHQLCLAISRQISASVEQAHPTANSQLLINMSVLQRSNKSMRHSVFLHGAILTGWQGMNAAGDLVHHTITLVPWALSSCLDKLDVASFIEKKHIRVLGQWQFFPLWVKQASTAHCSLEMDSLTWNLCRWTITGQGYLLFPEAPFDNIYFKLHHSFICRIYWCGSREALFS